MYLGKHVGERFSPSYDVALKKKWVWKRVPFMSLQEGEKNPTHHVATAGYADAYLAK